MTLAQQLIDASKDGGAAFIAFAVMVFLFAGSLFYMDINDLQTTVTAGSCSSRVIFNVPHARSTGFELEFDAAPNRHVDFALSTSVCSEVMPVLAACSTCTPLPMPSSRLLMSLARESSDWAVKKFVGLSRAEFTFLPVDNRFWVVARRSAVDCSESRFWRTEAERTIPDMDIPFWC